MRAIALSLLLAIPFAAGCQTAKDATPNPSNAQWRELFDGKTLTNWHVPEYGGDGEVRVENGRLTLNPGSPLTGATWKGAAIDRIDYEVEMRAARMKGDDFFALLTFPVGKGSTSLVLGGWHGEVIGLSSIDGMDADSNATRDIFEFEQGRFYDIKIRVTQAKVTVWIDDKQVIEHAVPTYEFTVRGDVNLSEPFGIVSYETVGAFERIRWRPLAENPQAKDPQ